MRMPALRHDQWTDDIRQTLATFSVPFSQYGLNGDETEKDKLSPILSTVLQNPELARVYFPFADYILKKSSLQPRHTRILILRVAWLWQFELEWAQHSVISVRDNLLTENEVKQIKLGATAEGWDAVEALLIQCVDQMHNCSNISDDVWNALTGSFNLKQMADITFTIGSYVMAGMYMNCFALPVSDSQKSSK